MGAQIVNREFVDELYGEGELYSAYGLYERKAHGYKVFKVPLNARFVCPNWDGRLSEDGCAFCPSHAKQFTYQNFREVIDKGFTEQIRHNVEHYKSVGAGEKGLVYIAFGTNTYAPVEKLRQILDETVSAHEDVIGFTVGTRPDCLPEEVLDLLGEYRSSGYEVWVEAGQQTTHQHTLREMNRQHGLAELIRAVDECHAREIPLLSFIILGMPGESHDEMMETARVISAMGVDAVKIYPLVVMKDTKLARMWEGGSYKSLGFMEYVNLVADFLEHLSPYVLIQRLSKDCGLEIKHAPEWNTYRNIVTPMVKKKLGERGTMQGSRHKLTLAADELIPLAEDKPGEFYEELKAQRKKKDA
ncbi:MAG: TIGR01212 family radical SAM protein [Candidatus Altiarchaeales archaeon]|nr:TIGR01212 family radical SAM protein [Candidatus Altiarchaeales archaeon]MBD3417045.1 TIGR01212 family radical SAM protein [Candidatus Altiarchaeales archaeon]